MLMVSSCELLQKIFSKKDMKRDSFSSSTTTLGSVHSMHEWNTDHISDPTFHLFALLHEHCKLKNIDDAYFSSHRNGEEEDIDDDDNYDNSETNKSCIENDEMDVLGETIEILSDNSSVCAVKGNLYERVSSLRNVKQISERVLDVVCEHDCESDEDTNEQMGDNIVTRLTNDTDSYKDRTVSGIFHDDAPDLGAKEDNHITTSQSSSFGDNDDRTSDEIVQCVGEEHTYGESSEGKDAPVNDASVTFTSASQDDGIINNNDIGDNIEKVERDSDSVSGDSDGSDDDSDVHIFHNDKYGDHNDWTKESVVSDVTVHICNSASTIAARKREDKMALLLQKIKLIIENDPEVLSTRTDIRNYRNSFYYDENELKKDVEPSLLYGMVICVLLLYTMTYRSLFSP